MSFHQWRPSCPLVESEDISVELLSPLLASVKKGDEEALPVAQKLGEKVLETCATKVKPYLIQAVKSLDVSLDDYSDIVGSMCQEISGSIEQKDVHAGDENKVSLLFY
ncbi:hypothetical protein NC652_037517 [Populus alba x Populus x berolinensis]|nr:hypothetical protein NC652_037517 [Populus alba x Populus x berolinensis]